MFPLNPHISTILNTEHNSKLIADHSKMNQFIVDELKLMQQTSVKCPLNIESNGNCYSQSISTNPYDIQEMLNVYNKHDHHLNYSPIIHSVSNANNDVQSSNQLMISTCNRNDYEKFVLNLTTQELANNVTYSSASSHAVNSNKPVTLLKQPSIFNLTTTIEHNPVNITELNNKSIYPWTNYSLDNNYALIPNFMTCYSTQTDVLNKNSLTNVTISNNNNNNNTLLWSTQQINKTLSESQNYSSINHESLYEESLSGGDDDDADDDDVDDGDVTDEQTDTAHKNINFNLNAAPEYQGRQLNHLNYTPHESSSSLNKITSTIFNTNDCLNSLKSIHFNKTNQLNQNNSNNNIEQQYSIINKTMNYSHVHNNLQNSFAKIQHLNNNNNNTTNNNSDVILQNPLNIDHYSMYSIDQTLN
ncbi:unnamed protein product [Schistosoma turkestanicum]|nr:unnamed protein product [Schistosoma turkestanicum]